MVECRLISPVRKSGPEADMRCRSVADVEDLRTGRGRKPENFVGCSGAKGGSLKFAGATAKLCVPSRMIT